MAVRNPTLLLQYSYRSGLHTETCWHAWQNNLFLFPGHGVSFKISCTVDLHRCWYCTWGNTEPEFWDLLHIFLHILPTYEYLSPRCCYWLTNVQDKRRASRLWETRIWYYFSFPFKVITTLSSGSLTVDNGSTSSGPQDAETRHAASHLVSKLLQRRQQRDPHLQAAMHSDLVLT